MRRFIKSIITGEGNVIFYILFRPLMICLSLIYLTAVSVINLLYRANILKSKELNAKVISVGNITWGGTGKTSIVMLLSNYLQSKNKKTAVLIRGYGSDEDKMLKEKLDKVLILSGKNRLKNAVDAQKSHHIDAFILDDGFQHWRMKRDLDIVVINATNPFGNKRLIPAGILREPICALRRSNIIMLNKVNLVDKDTIRDIKTKILDIAPGPEIFEAEYNPASLIKPDTGRELDAKYIADKKVCAIASVGDNESFFKMLLGLGVRITVKFAFPDHHRYTEGDMRNIVNTISKTDLDIVITTPKDWIRLKNYFNKNNCGKYEVLLLNSTIKVIDEEKFFNRIYSLLNR